MTKIYHPDAWRYGVMPDGYYAAKQAYVRSRPELVQACIDKAASKGLCTDDPLGPFGCVSWIATDVLMDKVPYWDFYEWAKEYRRAHE